MCIVGKLFLWYQNQIHPQNKGYQNKIAEKYETERKINEDFFF